MKRVIPFFEYPQLFKNNKEELISIFSDVSSRGAYILQNDLKNFENNLSDYSNSKFAIGVGNATDAMQIGLKLGGIRQGDEVIISAHTMIATAGAIVQAGAKPIPVDIGDDHLIDTNLIEEKITSKTRAIMPTHLNGRTCEMDSILEICKNYNLLLFEDAAQALGSKFKNRNAGTFGISSAISFYPAKSLGCLGDGGAILTNSEEIYTQSLAYRDHGRDPISGEVINWGVNSRLDNIQARILDYFLLDFEKVINRRRQIAEIYQKNLESITSLHLPPSPCNSSDHFDTFQNYEIRAKKRDELKNYLALEGVGTLIQWSGKAINHHKHLGMFSRLSKTDKFFNEILSLPINMFINDDDVFYIIDLIKNFYKN